MKRVLAIVNPVSGRGKGAALIPQISRYLEENGWHVEVVATESAGHASELANKAKRADWDALLAVGGDGTINEVIAGSRAEAMPIAIMPLGTGNVLAKEMGLNGAPMRALKRLVRGNTRRIDLARLNDGRYFVCMLSAGIDGEIIRAISEARAGGAMKMTAYVPLGLKAIFGATHRISIFRNEKLWLKSATYAICSNTRSFGGPIEIVSRADAADGELNLLAATLDMRIVYPAMVGAALVRSVSRIAGMVETVAESFRFESADGEEVPYQLDGEYAGVLPVAGKILPQALTIFADPI